MAGASLHGAACASPVARRSNGQKGELLFVKDYVDRIDACRLDFSSAVPIFSTRLVRTFIDEELEALCRELEATIKRIADSYTDARPKVEGHEPGALEHSNKLAAHIQVYNFIAACVHRLLEERRGPRVLSYLATRPVCIAYTDILFYAQFWHERERSTFNGCGCAIDLSLVTEEFSIDDLEALIGKIQAPHHSGLNDCLDRVVVELERMIRTLEVAPGLRVVQPDLGEQGRGVASHLGSAEDREGRLNRLADSVRVLQQHAYGFQQQARRNLFERITSSQWVATVGTVLTTLLGIVVYRNRATIMHRITGGTHPVSGAQSEPARGQGSVSEGSDERFEDVQR